MMAIRPAVAALKRRLLSADSLLIVPPEYNISTPGAFKNAIDRMSRPPEEVKRRHFGGKAVAVIGRLTRGLRHDAGPRVNTLMDENHELADQSTRDRLSAFLAGVCGICDELTLPDAATVAASLDDQGQRRFLNHSGRHLVAARRFEEVGAGDGEVDPTAWTPAFRKR
jgi:hypothetical protein